MGAHESRRGSDLTHVGEVPSTWLRIAGGSALLLLGPWILIGRQAGVSPTRSIYSEDGAIFLQGALDEGVGSVTTPYAGYLHAAPRLIALGVARFDLDWVAVMLVAAAGVVVCLSAWSVYLMSGDHLRSRAIRVALALTVILLPVAHGEVYNNIANLHWFLLYLAFWILLWEPQRWLEAVSASTVVFIAALSSPFAFLYAPIAAYRFRASTPRVLLVLSAYTVGVIVQLLVSLDPSVPRQTVGDDVPVEVDLFFDPVLFVHHYLFHVIGRGTLGSWVAGAERGPAGYVSVTVAVMLMAVLIVAWRLRSRRSNECLVIVAAIASVVLLAVPWSLSSGMIPPRYLVAPVLLYYVAASAMIDDLVSSSADAWQRGRRRVFMGGVLLLAVFVATTNYRVWSESSAEGDWPEQVQIARRACLADDVESASLPIFPAKLSLSVDVACESI